jgi:hypothetical protein
MEWSVDTEIDDIAYGQVDDHEVGSSPQLAMTYECKQKHAISQKAYSQNEKVHAWLEIASEYMVCFCVSRQKSGVLNEVGRFCVICNDHFHLNGNVVCTWKINKRDIQVVEECCHLLLIVGFVQQYQINAE